MLGNFLIGLREGLEAALVVSILVAYLVRSGRRNLVKQIWVGVAIVVVVCVGITVGLGLASRQLTFRTNELIGGSLSIVAAAFVTWMIFWMATAAKTIAVDLRNQVDASDQSAFGLVLVAVLAVGREGLETALILWTSTQQATGNQPGERTSVPIIAALLGIGAAVAIGYLLYRGAITLNLTRFFTWTGALLILVAAGVLSYGFHDLQEASILPGINSYAWDLSGTAYDAGSWYGTLLKGVLNFSAQTTKLEATVWLLYTVPVLALFIRTIRRRTPAPTPKVPVDA